MDPAAGGTGAGASSLDPAAASLAFLVPSSDALSAARSPGEWILASPTEASALFLFISELRGTIKFHAGLLQQGLFLPHVSRLLAKQVDSLRSAVSRNALEAASEFAASGCMLLCEAEPCHALLKVLMHKALACWVQRENSLRSLLWLTHFSSSKNRAIALQSAQLALTLMENGGLLHAKALDMPSLVLNLSHYFSCRCAAARGAAAQILALLAAYCGASALREAALATCVPEKARVIIDLLPLPALELTPTENEDEDILELSALGTFSPGSPSRWRRKNSSSAKSSRRTSFRDVLRTALRLRELDSSRAFSPLRPLAMENAPSSPPLLHKSSTHSFSLRASGLGASKFPLFRPERSLQPEPILVL
jgi:hypothetical protein